MSPQIPDYLFRECQATVKDDKLTMAFFIIKIMSTSKHSGSIAKNMQCLEVLDQSAVLQTKRRSPITPEIPLPCLCSLILLCIVIILTPNLRFLTRLWFHSLLGHDWSQAIGCQFIKVIFPSYVSLSNLLSTQSVYVLWHRNTLSYINPRWLRRCNAVHELADTALPQHPGYQ